MEWTWEPDANDQTYVVDYAFLLHRRDGTETVEHHRHVLRLVSRAQWLEWLGAAGLPALVETDRWRGEVFTGVRS